MTWVADGEKDVMFGDEKETVYQYGFMSNGLGFTNR